MTNNKVKTASISDAAVEKSTGKKWNEWFAIIDKEGSTSRSHKEIVTFLKEHYSLSPWYQQMITVGYEQVRGKRKIHEMPDGFQISKTRTFPWGTSELRDTWLNEKMRRKWLEDSNIQITNTKGESSLRFIRGGDSSRYEVRFYPLEGTRTRLTVQQNKIPDARTAGEMKKYWERQLQNLFEYLQKEYPRL